jgi:hypothetical protein
MIRQIIGIGLLILINHAVIHCQPIDYVRGKVIDSRTFQPVPYATVRLKNSQVGVITNAEGDFRILNNPGFQSDSLIVTCIGFNRLSIPFSRLERPEINNLRLVTYTYGLKEVRINARKNRRLSSQLIIGRALRNIKKNCPVNPYSYVSYYRDYQKDSINYLNLNEAIVQTLDNGFTHLIGNHWFANPDGVHEGNTLLYKIGFTAKRQITGDNIRMKGAIFIQPNDYSIHRLEYSASFFNSEKKNKEIFNIEIEYGHEPAVDSKMCLKYISFNNYFTIPDSADNNYFKILKSEWEKAGGPYTRLRNEKSPNMTIITFFNRKIDPVSGGRRENYMLTLGERIAKINKILVAGDTLYLTLKDDKFSNSEINSCKLNIKNLKDINGNILDKRRDLEFRQFRELFVQEYNKPFEFQNNCFIQTGPLEQNCISVSDNSARFWMNTPLKAEEKQQNSQND